ncbi:hypothetical protein MASR2M12_19800 [Bacteroidales bacterium]
MKKQTFLFLVSISLMKGLYSQDNNFIQAYENMHLQLSFEYPMSSWKAIDWPQLDALIRPKVIDAAERHDSVGFYIALREYLTYLHDGHVNMRRGWTSIAQRAMYRQIGGSYGFATCLTDDGQLAATIVNPGSPADGAGMKFGARLLEINEQSARQVLDTVSVSWAELIPATAEGKLLNQCRFIGRAPIGNLLKVKFLNRNQTNPITATLTAVDDQYETYHQTNMWVVEPGPEVSSAFIPDTPFGYIKLTTESSGADSTITKKIYTDFRDALQQFKEHDVKGLILDMRINSGGLDALSAALAGFFYTEPVLYENLSYYDPELGSLEIFPIPIPTFDPETLKPRYNPDYPDGALFIEPQLLNFSQPVMVMVSPRGVSSGEGLPMALQKLPQCKVVGFHGTHGSFALVGTLYNVISPPDSLCILYPFGCSLDKNFQIQLDSDADFFGGVMPDYRVPINDTVLDQLYLQHQDVELKYAIKILNSILGNVSEMSPGNTGLQLEIALPASSDKVLALRYTLWTTADIRLEIFDLNGRKIRSIINDRNTAGTHIVYFDSSGLDSGIYLFTLTDGKSIVSKKWVYQR